MKKTASKATKKATKKAIVFTGKHEVSHTMTFSKIRPVVCPEEFNAPMHTIATIQPIVEQVQEVNEVQKLKEIVLSVLSNQGFLEFFDERMLKVIAEENKLKNLASFQRVSGYESLPYTFPFYVDEKTGITGKGFSGTRGRCIFALATGMIAKDFIAFEFSNRKHFNQENNDNTAFTRKLIRRTLQAQCKAYYPSINFKGSYSMSIFK